MLKVLLTNTLIYLPSCGSTNDEILPLLCAGKVSGVYTFHQTKGRGQYGNQWLGQENQNIAISIAIPASAIKISPVFFNYHTANLCRKFIANLTNTDAKIKWPNDIILNRKKVSGILIETQKTSSEKFYITGIGLNVLQKNFGDITNAGSLFTETEKNFDLNETAEDLFAYISGEMLKPISEGQILEEFNHNLFRKDEVSVFELIGARQNGIIKFADEGGYLWIQLEHLGLKKFFHKEISLLY